MAHFVGKEFSQLPLFDPAGGTVIRAPLGSGPGWWAGAPCASFDGGLSAPLRPA